MENNEPKPETTEAPTSEATEQPIPAHEQPKKSNKKFLLIGLVLLILVPLVFATYKYLPTKTTPSPTPTIVKPTSTPDPTASWKTYSGRGLKFNYPSNYKQTETEEFINLIKDGQNPTNGEISPAGTLISIGERGISEGNLNENDLLKLYPTGKILKVNISGMPSFSVIVGKNRNVYIPKGGNMNLYVGLSFGDNVTEDVRKVGMEEFDKILSTFKFTN